MYHLIHDLPHTIYIMYIQYYHIQSKLQRYCCCLFSFAVMNVTKTELLSQFFELISFCLGQLITMLLHVFIM